MQQVKSGDKIKVHYHGRLTNGETFDKLKAGSRSNLKWAVAWLLKVLMMV